MLVHWFDVPEEEKPAEEESNQPEIQSQRRPSNRKRDGKSETNADVMYYPVCQTEYRIFQAAKWFSAARPAI